MTPTAQKLEALLFVKAQGLAKKQLRKLLAITEEELEAAAAELAESLQAHGITLVRTHAELQLATASEVSDIVAHFAQEIEDTLSAAAAETLALVAYRGPISAADIAAVRGVDSRRMLQQLEQRELVSAKGSDELTYVVTPLTLRSLGVSSLQELPKFAELSSPEALQSSLSDKE